MYGVKAVHGPYMTLSDDFTPTRWPRFDRYIIEAGYIRPAPGAKLTWYDPWEPFLEVRGESLGDGAAYHRLLNAVPRDLKMRKPDPGQRLKFLRPGIVDWTVSKIWTDSYQDYNEQAISDWCSGHGLLGLLPHRLLYAAFRSESNIPVSLERKGGRWMWFKWDHLARLVGQDWHPHAMLRSYGRAVREPLGSTWARYFPSVPVDQCERFEYPSPDTDEFWRLYAEPVDEFLRVADQLAQCLRSITEIPEPRKGREALTPVPHQVKLYPGLNDFLEPVQPCLDLSGAKPQARYWSPSLLGLLALMIREDLARAGGRVVTCICGLMFIHPSKNYCCSTHQNTAEKRRQREKAAKLKAADSRKAKRKPAERKKPKQRARKSPSHPR